MAEKKRCIRCDRPIDAYARICPYCNWDQSDPNVPRPEETVAPVYEPKRELPLRKYALMALGGVVLLIVAFTLGSHIHGTNPPKTPADAASEATSTAPVRPAPHPDITLVPATDTGAIAPQPITSAPAPNATAGIPTEYQRSDATAVSSAEYAQMAARAQAEKKQPREIVDPRSLRGPAYAQGARPEPPQPQISSSSAEPPLETTGTAPVREPSRRVARTAPVPEYQPVPDIQVSETTTVRLNLTIGADGRVKEVDIGGQGIEGQTGKIISTVQTWRFRPATENGVSVPSTFSTALSFVGNH